MSAVKKTCLFFVYGGFLAILLAPLLLDNSFFFPFITTKVLIFRVAVEVMLLAYLVLNIVSAEYRPRFNWMTVFVVLFMLVAAVSSVFGANPSGSFWGDIERGDGLLMWLHLLVFLVILTAVARERKIFLRLLDFSLGVAILLSLFGLGQVFKVQGLLSTSGSRVDATLGNAAFFAAYLLLHFGFAIYLFISRKNWGARVYYAVSAALFAALMLATQTRGAVVGLAVGLVFVAILLLASQRGNPRVKRASVGLILFVVLVAAAGAAVRNQAWVQKTPVLQRLVSISLSERTAETRLATWQAAWKGFLEKPAIGWGMENFNVVFNKYFPPIIYIKAGSQVWFDRAHNVLLDRAVTTGLLGLAFFLALFLYPIYYLIRHYLKDPEHRAAAVLFPSLLAAYLVQDMFIFESAVTYIILFLLFGLLSSVFLPKWERSDQFFAKRYLWIALAVLYGAGFWTILWNVNVYPAKVNIAAAAALRSDPDKEDFFMVVEKHKKYLDLPKYTYGLPEYRLNFIDFIGQQLAPVGEIVERVKPVLAYTDGQVERQIHDQPDDAKNWLLAMRHYNYTYLSLPGKQYDRLEKALSYFDTLKKLSPTRPHVYQEAGYSYIYLYRLAKQDGKTALADSAYLAAEENFIKTIDLQPQVYDSYVNLISLYLKAGQSDKIAAVIARMEENQIDFRTEERARNLFNLSKNSEDYRWAAFWAEELTKIAPDDPQHFIHWALSEAYQGHRQKAIQIAEIIRKFGGTYGSEADQFIANIKSGFYEKQLRQK